ncbi:MAG: AMP-binding protein [Vicinamibacterales bacterium]
MRGYHNAAEANARAFTTDGFYRTGDIVRQLPTGHLIVLGRAGDQIDRGGEKLSPEEIEEHLLAHPDVFDAVVVSVPDKYMGERACAYVVARGERPKPGALKASDPPAWAGRLQGARSDLLHRQHADDRRRQDQPT